MDAALQASPPSARRSRGRSQTEIYKDYDDVLKFCTHFVNQIQRIDMMYESIVFNFVHSWMIDKVSFRSIVISIRLDSNPKGSFVGGWCPPRRHSGGMVNDLSPDHNGDQHSWKSIRFALSWTHWFCCVWFPIFVVPDTAAGIWLAIDYMIRCCTLLRTSLSVWFTQHTMLSFTDNVYNYES